MLQRGVEWGTGSLLMHFQFIKVSELTQETFHDAYMGDEDQSPRDGDSISERMIEMTSNGRSIARGSKAFRFRQMGDVMAHREMT